jgi:superfamily II DNA/RNA helicase
VVTPDAETALAVADAALAGRPGADPVVLPVTRPERAARQLAARPAPVVAGTPAALAALVRGASLKLGQLRTLVLAWADEALAVPGAAAEFEALLAEVPRDAARLLVAATVTDEVAALVDRIMFRARRVDAQPRAAEPLAVSYVTVRPDGAARRAPSGARRARPGGGGRGGGHRCGRGGGPPYAASPGLRRRGQHAGGPRDGR